MERSLLMMKWQSQFLTTVAQSISSRKQRSRSMRSWRWIFMMEVKQSMSPSISSSQQSLQATTVATQSTHALSSSLTRRLVLTQYRVKMQRDSVMRKGCGVSQMSCTVSRFISSRGISIDRMVRTTLSDRSSSLNISSLDEEEKSSSLMRMDIFLLLQRVARASQCSRESPLGTASASKQMRDPKVIFLKDSIFSFFFSEVRRSDDLAYLLRRSWTSVQSLRLVRNSRRKRRTFSKRSSSCCWLRSIFWLCVWKVTTSSSSTSGGTQCSGRSAPPMWHSVFIVLFWLRVSIKVLYYQWKKIACRQTPAKTQYFSPPPDPRRVALVEANPQEHMGTI